LPGQAGGFCGWSMMKKTKAGSWSTGVSSIVFVFVGIAAVVTICPGVAAVVAVDNFLTDGTVAPTVVSPEGVVGLQDCDVFFGITTPDDCMAACGRFLLNFQLYTVDWVAVEEVDGENENPENNNNNNNSVGVDDDDDVIANDDDENLILSSAAAAAAYIDVQKIDANAKTNGLRKLYAGFICQCPNQPNQSINCVYTYDFPSCQAVGVVDCSDTDLIVSNTKDPPPPPISVTLAPAVAPEPPPSLPPVQNDGNLSQTLNGTAIDESTFNNNTNATITNATERFRYQWRRRRKMLIKRDLQGFDDESDVFLDGMFNATEGPPGTNDAGNGSNSSMLGRNNVTSLISEEDIVNNDGNNNNNNTANATSIQNDTNSTSASNSNSSSSSNSNSTPISCASFCHSLGMDVGANGAGQTSKNNINNKATRTICAANPGDDNDIDDVNSNSTVISSWVACACQVRSAFSNDGSNNVYVTEGFYVCGDEGFNKTGIVLGSSGSVGGHHIRRNNILGWIGLFGLLLIHTTIHVLY